ncbi:hypothetical protein KFK09_005379 [Dendrobium nobile]|uniref:Uncharacterized protein n=1 Tax=Dendrobium nobile TaxID=94219 RepID=A0A8T3BVH6_DENNO|nr:hypothetical protein KFK09_005379 [Dendrobium nobile]
MAMKASEKQNCTKLAAMALVSLLLLSSSHYCYAEASVRYTIYLSPSQENKALEMEENGHHLVVFGTAAAIRSSTAGAANSSWPERSIAGATN